MTKKSLFGKILISGRDKLVITPDNKAGKFTAGDVIISMSIISDWNNNLTVVLGKIRYHELDYLVGYTLKERDVSISQIQTKPDISDYSLLRKVNVTKKERETLIKNIKKIMTLRIDKKILEAV